MGYKLLIFVTFFSSFILANTQYPDIDRLIEQVKTKRVGLSKKEIEKLQNPFINEKKLQKIIKKQKVAKKKPKRRIHLKLYSIFNNRAKINGKWYTIGNTIYGYRLVKIDKGKKRVILFKKKRMLVLYLNNVNKRKFKLLKM
ncbi:hypothetical protein [Nitratiruptor tergarcus]|uniref:Uncharacterized protein n=1 Tax=Nitratiruptor tergarcus DSM 16512 TaxID=1069081 RepID=A0A1W1WV77_9BACT|nr:hypothetical protein [Nitratiruptor tergarcus]SMC09633.1 hypothetical protein SAMN05660197_1454 [Nitratiruptor tergarcus DSM 16512]